MDFGKYIHELLLENDIVIIPGFGAFVSEYKPAEISEESDEIKPPSKIVSFNQQIRNNDGLLVGHVAEKKRISHFDALIRIEKERENILYQLDGGEQVEIDEIGVLYYTEEHTIAFKAKEDENLFLDSFGLEATTIAVEEDIIEEEQIITPPIIAEDEEIEEPTIQEEIIVEEKIRIEEEQIKDTIEEPAPIPVIETTPEIPKAEEEPEEKKKKRGWLWLLLILIPLIAVTVFIFMKEQKDGGKKKETESGITIIEQPNAIAQDSINTVSTVKDSVEITTQDTIPLEESKPESEVSPAPTTPKYYLVGGSFSVEDNANTYLNELKAKGYDAFHVGKKGRFFIVGIGTYDTLNEAEKAKKEYITDHPGSEVWVYKK